MLRDPQVLGSQISRRREAEFRNCSSRVSVSAQHDVAARSDDWPGHALRRTLPRCEAPGNHPAPSTLRLPDLNFSQSAFAPSLGGAVGAPHGSHTHVRSRWSNQPHQEPSSNKRGSLCLQLGADPCERISCARRSGSWTASLEWVKPFGCILPRPSGPSADIESLWRLARTAIPDPRPRKSANTAGCPRSSRGTGSRTCSPTRVARRTRIKWRRSGRNRS